MKLLNAFSLNMLTELNGEVSYATISLAQAKDLAKVGALVSAVGHADTATVYGSQLGIVVPAVRSTVSLVKGEQVLIGQYRGPRLPEGATELPEGAEIIWILLAVK